MLVVPDALASPDIPWKSDAVFSSFGVKTSGVLYAVVFWEISGDGMQVTGFAVFFFDRWPLC